MFRCAASKIPSSPVGESAVWIFQSALKNVEGNISGNSANEI